MNRSLLTRTVIRGLSQAAAFLLLSAGCAPVQGSSLYFPRVYPGGFEERLPETVRPLRYDTGEGTQVAFYVPPRNSVGGAEPETLWVLFHGNAATALSWLPYIRTFPDEKAGFLLVDYPGYGACEGSPSRPGIIENGDGALGALARSLEIPKESLQTDLATLGFSLGSAAAMEFAVRHPVRRVVLLAPFTSITDMAERRFGFLGHAAVDRFDSMARLEELAQREDPPSVRIVHGTSDEVIPFTMGEELAEAHPELARLTPVEGSGHNDLIARNWALIGKVATED